MTHIYIYCTRILYIIRVRASEYIIIIIDLMKYICVPMCLFSFSVDRGRGGVVHIPAQTRRGARALHMMIMKQVEPSSSRKLVQQPQTVSSRDAMRASTTLPSPSTGRSGDGGHFSRSSNVSVRRRGELHKKLESLHERQSVRSGSLLDRFRQELPGDLPSLGESTYDA